MLKIYIDEFIKKSLFSNKDKINSFFIDNIRIKKTFVKKYNSFIRCLETKNYKSDFGPFPNESNEVNCEIFGSFFLGALGRSFID